MHKLVTANNENKLDIAPLQTDKFVSHIVAVDLGSNSFHIIIAREQDGCLHVSYPHLTLPTTREL